MWIFQPLGLLLILVYHWLLDFVFQTNEMATNKWHSNFQLMYHTGIYSLCWFPLVIAIAVSIKPDTPIILLFMPITFVTHTAIDYITSRETHKYFEKKNTHNAFVIIGFDQILHYIQIYLTFYLLVHA